MQAKRFEEIKSVYKRNGRTLSQPRKNNEAVVLNKKLRSSSPQLDKKENQLRGLSLKSIILLFFCRLFLCLSVATIESPDSWWQSVEVAYFIVFGKGHLSWEWHEAIRSIFFPLIYAVPFYILKLSGMDTAWSIWFVQQVLQALILSSIDACVYRMGACLDEEMEKGLEIEPVVICDSSPLIPVKTPRRLQNGGARNASLGKRSVTPGRESLGPAQERKMRCRSPRNSPISPRAKSKEVSNDNSHEEAIDSDGVVEHKSNTYSVASFALLLSLTNWYMTFSGSRAYSNVVEALFVILAVQQRGYISYLWWSGVACGVRVTSAIILFPLIFGHIAQSIRQRGIFRGLIYISFGGIVIGFIVQGFCMVLDYLLFKRWVITYIEFFRFNILKNVSSFYGVHTWYAYVLVFLPVILGPQVFFLVNTSFLLFSRHVNIATRNILWRLGMSIICALLFLSTIAHKEMRFVFSLLPFFFVLEGLTLARAFGTSKFIRRIHIFGIVLHILVFLVVCGLYRRAPLDAMAEIRNGPKIGRLHVLSTCYTTPGYSFIHNKVDHLDMIDCSLTFDDVTNERKLTEDVIFSRYPKDYVMWKFDGVHTFNMSDAEEIKKADELTKTVVPKTAMYPDVFLIYRNTVNLIKDSFLRPHGYILYRSFFHAPLVLAPYEDIYMEMWIKKPDV